ncbi:NmrA family transcriptional regulator [Amycolatopsis deserti]|uniref:NmrA family transcriptional regulator n=1 Tax=Amycolatopsis deserti TaxID=185696 RepID=A0ABQ3IF16_9PSEU|nr:NAD(P)H-binding protein [Amycolatopsis deserti]GHE82003.1 NmrA family transcriptional regulator [Amycolatopsis deserti]
MIVITGATGNVGRPLVQTLAAAGEVVTAVSRRISATDAPAGVRVRQGDLAEPANLKGAFDGADAVFLLTSGDFVGSGGNLREVMDVVRAAGVRRVVLLSSQGVSSGNHSAELEDAVTASGLEWTMLRPGNFSSNAFQWADSVRTQRIVAAPFGDVALPAVDPLDIADVAGVVLRKPGHVGKIYDLTGPAPISPREQAAAIGDAVGEPVEFVELTRAEAKSAMVRFMPEPVVENTLDLLGTPPAVIQQVSPDIEEVLGRAPRSFADWAARNAAAFK